ncbi:FecR domain-containing protein [Myxococcus stipitatus]|uniref:FecR domain-containing protein n=1 Tax=Myxococcus stipitatus TaxID=83455 RepID=UPI0030CD25F9
MAHLETGALWALAANESTAEETARAQAHLSQCASCTEALERTRMTRAMLHEARTEQPSVDWDTLGTKLRSEAAARLAKGSSRWQWPRMPAVRWPWGLALAGAVAAMVALWVVLPGGPATRVGASDAVVAEQSAMGSSTQVAMKGSVHPHESDAAHAESTTGAMMRERGGELRELHAGMRLSSGAAVKTPARASAMLRLPDASRAKLSSESEVELSRAEARDVHLTVRQGRLSVKASHAEQRGFRVDVAALRVWVVGTVFTVERTAEGASVAVAEGRVRVESDGRPPRMVGAGERLELRERDSDLKQEPLSAPDREALDAMQLAPEPSPPEAGLTVPTAANTPESSQTVRPAVAHAPQAPGTVKPALATTPSTPVEPKSKVMSASMAVRHDNKPQAQAADAPHPSPETTSPVAKAGSTATPRSGANPELEFEPYPAPSVAESLPPPPPPPPASIQAPSPPVQVAQTPPPKKKEGLIPMSLLSKDSDERFLGYARLQMGPRTCENFLTGLEEIADKSPRPDHREQARYLRARCFEERLQGQDAKMEYRQYLNEFPRGRYAREAGAAILP